MEEVVYLHPSIFRSWDYHIRKGKIINIEDGKYQIDPSKSNFYGHTVWVGPELINPSQEFIESLRKKGKSIMELKSSAWR